MSHPRRAPSAASARRAQGGPVMRTGLSIVFVLILSAEAAEPAPAPLPRAKADAAEVVFDAQTKGRAHLAQIRLRSLLQGHDASLDGSNGGTLVRLRLRGGA